MAESTVGPWAADKLDRLQKYLRAYTTIMAKQEWCKGFAYIDAFAGPGSYLIRTARSAKSKVTQALLDASGDALEDNGQRQFLAGSPRVALEIEHPFTWYVFLEKSPDRIAQLERLKQEFGNTRKIRVRKGDCNQYLIDKVARNPDLNWKELRGVVFLDPFGMQVPWSTIAALASTNAIEIFLNFPSGMAIQRLLRRRVDEFTQKDRDKLDTYFGSPAWFNAVYKRERTLFDDEDTRKVEQSGKALVKWYQSRLREIFKYVSKAALIRNTKGGHLYYILLATPKKTGRNIINDILSAGEVI